MAIGQIIKRLREERGLSQTQLAKAAGLHYTRIYRVETGREKLSRIETFAAVADALGLEIGELYTECYKSESPPTE